MSNIKRVRGRLDDPRLRNESIDAALLADAYHEFSHPHEMMACIIRAMRPGERVFLVEYRGEDRRIPINPLHKMTSTLAVLEKAAVGLKHLETCGFLPTQHFMVFERPG